jgi:hypothetical protein
MLAMPHYIETCLKRNLKSPEHFSHVARLPFNQRTVWQITGPENISV